MQEIARKLHPLAPIDAYGNGGFRFADMSHRGSLLCLPSGMRPLDVERIEQLDRAALQPMFDESGSVDILVLGTGNSLWRLPPALRDELRALHIGFEVGLTGTAIRIYNIVLAEGRRVAAALIAVG